MYILRVKVKRYILRLYEGLGWVGLTVGCCRGTCSPLLGYPHAPPPAA